MLITYLEMPFCDHLKDQNTKKLSPRFARHKRHIEYFMWRAAAETWHIFFMKASPNWADEIENVKIS